MKLSITKTLAAASATFGLAMLAACDDASSTVSSDNTTSETPAGITVVDSYKSLPDCKKSNDGSMVYVASTSEVYYCIESKWTSVNGKDGKDGKNGADGKDGENGKNGTDGTDGTGCSAKLAGDVILVSCAGVVIDSITNGIDGTDGTDGANGKKGETGDNGKDGSNGANCSAKSITEGIEVSCAGIVIDTLTNGKDGSNGSNGSNGTSCSAKTIAEGIEVSCGDVVVDTLTNGSNGSNGTNCSAKTIAEGIEISCAGAVVDTLTNGKDGKNGDSYSAKVIAEGIEISRNGIATDTLTNAKNGTNGTSCSARTIAEGIEVSCDGEVVDTLTNGKDGKDGVNCTAKENSAGDGVEIVCDNGETTSIAYRTNGTDGTTCSAEDFADLENGKTGYMLICDGKEMGFINNIGDDADGSGLCTIEESTSGYIALICGNKVAYLQGYIPESSSSRERPTSSEIGPTSSEDDLCEGKTLADNQMCDPRDGTVYKTVKIGDATWFAENIQYKDVIQKRTYSETLYSRTSGVCPDGWHVPSKAEFDNLVAATGETDTKKQAMALASTDWEVTDDDDNVIWKGTDALGFNIQPTGNCGSRDCWNYDKYAAFWTSTYISGSTTTKYTMEFQIDEEVLEDSTKKYIGNSLNYGTNIGSYYISIRCVKD